MLTHCINYNFQSNIFFILIFFVKNDMKQDKYTKAKHTIGAI